MSKSLGKKRDRRITALNILKEQLKRGIKPVKKSSYRATPFTIKEGDTIQNNKGDSIFFNTPAHIGKPLKKDNDGNTTLKRNEDGTVQPELLEFLPLSPYDEARIKKEITTLEKKTGYAI